jgi:hypothetical protein
VTSTQWGLRSGVIRSGVTQRGQDPNHSRDNRSMRPALSAALADVAPLIASRGWVAPARETITAAERLLALVEAMPRQPAVQVEPDGTISFEWEAAEHGWLTLTVDDAGQLTHGAVLGEDEFTQSEAFGDALPDWANTLLQRLLAAGH